MLLRLGVPRRSCRAHLPLGSVLFLPLYPVLSPETLGSFLCRQQDYHLHLLLFHTLFFFLSSSFTKTFRMYTFYPPTIFFKLWFLSVPRIFGLRPSVCALASTHMKQISLNPSLTIVTIHDILWSVLFFFFFPCKEKCVSGDPVYWFPIRDQQSRKEYLGYSQLVVDLYMWTVKGTLY